MDQNTHGAMNRNYKSDTSLISSLQNPHKEQFPLFKSAQSEPNLSSRKVNSAVEYQASARPPSLQELFAAVEVLENIVAEGNLLGQRQKYQATGHVSDTVLRIVYGTMKYLPYIDKILVKTQFLVYNTQFLSSLCLVKVMMYELMKRNFEWRKFSFLGSDGEEICVDSSDRQRREIAELECAFKEHTVKLAAAFARIRVSTQAVGSTNYQKMENILPQEVRDKESKAVEMPKTLRINYATTNLEEIAHHFVESEFPFESSAADETRANVIHLDDEFTDLIIVPSIYFAQLKLSPLITAGKLIFQDKASLYAPKHLSNILAIPGCQIIDARAGCGTKSSYISHLLPKQTIYAFEGRPARLPSLQSHLEKTKAQNVTVIPHSFTTTQVRDYADVTAIIVEPPNSGSAIMDRLGFLLQEEEFPVQGSSQKDLLVLKKTQLSYLKHAFSFPSVQHIIYVTRSIWSVENQDVVMEILERYGVDWELSCVLPDISSDDGHEWLQIEPSDDHGNGIFICHFQRKNIVSKAEENDLAVAAESFPMDNEEFDDTTNNESQISMTAMNDSLPQRKPGKIIRESIKAAQLGIKQKRASHVSFDSNKGDSDDEDLSLTDEPKASTRFKNQISGRVLPKVDTFMLSGFGLKRFYAPQFAALRKLQSNYQRRNVDAASASFSKLWSYPVPNPSPWK